MTGTDWISRQAVKEWLAKWEGYLDADMIARMQYRVIDIQNAQPESQWIPCSERLPENDDWQIVTVCDESSDRSYIYSDFGWYLEAADCWIVDADQRRDITAWMPLPEPWRGEQT